MKTASSAEPETISRVPPGHTHFAWMLAAASIAVIVFIYFFAFRAAHEVQIREVPLATKGGRP